MKVQMRFILFGRMDLSAPLPPALMRGKTGEEVAIPISPTLQAALDLFPDHEAETVLASSRGEAWTYNGFSTVWHRFKIKLEEEGLIAPGLTLKGLRHTVATTLREAGLDERRIADLLGQKTPSMARHYCNLVGPSCGSTNVPSGTR